MKILNDLKRVILPVIFILCIFCSCDSKISDFVVEDSTTVVVNQSEKIELNGPYKVVRVVDGDTLILDIENSETRVRLIGVDTPESVHPDKNKNSEEGKEASEFTKEQLKNKSVYLEYDKDVEDDYGRTLAYVYMDKRGSEMLQDILLKNGYASVKTILPNIKYAEHFKSVQKEAKSKKIGLWKENYFAED